MNTVTHTAETEAALDGSIAKWEGIVAGTVKDHGVANCLLCQRFMDVEDEDGDGELQCCGGCPVRVKTNASCCDGSPYEQWAKYQIAGGFDRIPFSVFDAESRRLAQAELDFLRSLK